MPRRTRRAPSKATRNLGTLNHDATDFPTQFTLAAGWNAARRCSWFGDESSVRWGAFPHGGFPKSGTTSWARPAHQRGAAARIGAGDRDKTGHERGSTRPADEEKRTKEKPGKEKDGKLLRKEKTVGSHLTAIDNPHRRCSAWLGGMAGKVARDIMVFSVHLVLGDSTLLF
jgi:hypothetical protein